MNRTAWLVPLAVLSVALLPGDARAASKTDALDPAGIARLQADKGGSVDVRVNPATGAASFVTMKEGTRGGLVTGAAVSAEARQVRTAEFFRSYGRIFGIVNPDAELSAGRVLRDEDGGSHLTYRQLHHGIPVFAGELKSHFDASGDLVAVNGTFIPEISIDISPRRSAEDAGERAISTVESGLARSGGLTVDSSRLLVFREGLAKGIPGANHLAWEVVVGDGAGIREFVYVDAHSNKVIDQISGTQDALNRRAYDGQHLPAPPPEYPGTPFWVEGQAFPTGTTEADNMIIASKETYDFYSKAFARDSFDGAGGTMDSIFNRGYQCPNASWNGTFISFCEGLTTDDVTGHEWTHAYTQYTHGLIYQWQPGALNESYSDIFGETIDRINGRGGDTPDNPRTANACSQFTPLPPTVTVNSPAAIAGVKPAGTAAFGPQSFTVTNDVVIADDGVGTLNDGCCAATADPATSFFCAPNSWTNAAAVAGKIAFVDRGTCGFAIKAKNAQVNGAIGVIIGNNQAGNTVSNMAGVDASITIPSLLVSQNNGTAIKGAASTVNATLSRGAVGTDNSVRWLLGEDDTAAGLSGALRDMWSPNCYGNPAKVVDPAYVCGTGDNGGVHGNSGVPNHGYALVVDGGTFNGKTIAGIGLTKAAHIYFRAMKIYQGPASGFADHADALLQSCKDLTGKNLKSLTTGAYSGEVITRANCTQVANAIAAVELRTPPDFCNFQPLLAQAPPPLCAPRTKAKAIRALPPNRWTVSHEAVVPADFTDRDWDVVGNLPLDRPGRAFFGAAPDIGTCAPGGDESGVLHLDSPVIKIPTGPATPKLTFVHSVATEAGVDGGNLKISVNGGAWTLVAAADFIYNPYNTTLVTAAQGNTNPLQSQPAFSGSDGGQVTGAWGRSIVNLAPYAVAGDEVRLRFDIGTDGCGGLFGWYLDLDEINAYTCK